MDEASPSLVGAGQARYHPSFPCPSYAYTRQGGRALDAAYYGCLGVDVKRACVFHGKAATASRANLRGLAERTDADARTQKRID
jgi:hypothetical protein